MNALGMTHWWGPSATIGYRPYAMGPRPLTGVAVPGCAPCVLAGPESWPSARRGGGWATPFDGPLGDAQNAPGWSTPFDNPHLTQAINDTRAVPTVGLGAMEPRPWSSTMTPTVDPSFVWQGAGKGMVQYANVPYYKANIEPKPIQPYPLCPNRGSFNGPYGAHQLPYYGVLRSTTAQVVPEWPKLRASNVGINAHFVADKSWNVLPSPTFIQAARTYMMPGIHKTASNAWPGGVGYESRGSWDFRQNRRYPVAARTKKIF